MKRYISLSLLLLFLTLTSYAEELTPSLTLKIPMRDGTELPTDLYFPKERHPSECPCVLIRSPAGKQFYVALRYRSLIEHGYVVAIQSTRSSLDENGKTFPGISDAWGAEKDGYDAVEWLAASDYCNGKVGTAGVSVLGIMQLLLAPSAPPSLKCQYIGYAASSIFHHALCPGGQVLKDQVEGWLSLYAWDTGVLSYAQSRLFYNDFWEQFDTNKVAYQIEVPALLYTGWYDTFLQGTIDAFVSRQNKGGLKAKGKQKLLIGPWTHFWPESKKLGDFTIPEEGSTPPMDVSMKRWFDRYLKEIANGAEDIPAVIYYLMVPFDNAKSGGNQWRFAKEWPVPAVQEDFYLTNQQTLSKNNFLNEKIFNFENDPLNPVPTLGGRNLFIESGPKDQRPIENRRDMLVFTSPVLGEEIEVTGNVKCKLFCSSDQVDTDFVVRLTDVYPDGRSILITDGLLRTGILDRKGWKIKPHEIFEIDVDLSPTSIVFSKGHKIRVTVSSSNYPRYERNFNIGLLGINSGDYAVAKNRIYVGGEHKSRLILPVVKK